MLTNPCNFYFFVLSVKMSSQTSPVCAVQDLSHVWAVCGQALGEAEYWAGHKSVGSVVVVVSGWLLWDVEGATSFCSNKTPGSVLVGTLSSCFLLHVSVYIFHGKRIFVTYVLFQVELKQR